ncbi:MAG: hypothetical protein ACC682_00440 [Gemmatimonadota bacterium]
MTLALVFVAGAAAGIAGDRLDLIPRAAEATEAETPNGATESAENQTIIEEFADELGLSSGQRMEIDLLLDYYAASLKELRHAVRPQYQALMDSVRVEIEAVLDDGQRGEYRTLIDERYGAGSDSSTATASDPDG